MRRSITIGRWRLSGCSAGVLMPLILLACVSTTQAELVTGWKQVDSDTVLTEIGGVDLTIDSSADVFANGSYDATEYGLKFDNGKFESLAVSKLSTLTLTIPSTYRFTRVAIVGINGTGTNPVISVKGGWDLEQVVEGKSTTKVDGSDLYYLSPFVAEVLMLVTKTTSTLDKDLESPFAPMPTSGYYTLQMTFSDQMEDDPFGFDIEIEPVDTNPVPEPAGMPVVAAMGLLWYRRRRQKSRQQSALAKIASSSQQIL